MNLAHFLRRAARRWPDAIGLAWGDRSWSWGALDARVDAMAAALAARGIAKGDRVLVQARNGNPLFESMFVCFRLGAVWVPTNFRQTPAEVAYLARASGASALICGTEFPDHAAAIRAAAPGLGLVVEIGGSAFGWITTPWSARMRGRRPRPPMSSTTTRAGSSSPRAPPAGPRRRCSPTARWPSSSPTISAT